jgi:glucosamine--fructose-6-phosphate aminotransferase (isomerizing)
MESLGNFPDSFLAEIAGQPAALARAARATVGRRDALLEVARVAAVRSSVVVTGMGASYFAGYPAVNRLAEASVPALHVDAAELLHFRRSLLDDSCVLVLVSQSGESAEPVALAAAVRQSRSAPFMVTVTNGTANRLARDADVALDSAAGTEAGPSTVTFAASLVVLRAVADALVAGRAAPKGPEGLHPHGPQGLPSDSPEARLRDALEALPPDAERAAAAAEGLLGPDPAALARTIGYWIGYPRALVTLGRGSARAAAELGALILKEAARIPAEALQSAQFRHGPLELAGGELAAFVVATEEPTEALDIGLAAELAEQRASVVAITADGPKPAGVHRLPIGPVDPSLRPAVAAIPMELLAWRRGVERGFDPGRLHVAAKVTTHE